MRIYIGENTLVIYSVMSNSDRNLMGNSINKNKCIFLNRLFMISFHLY